MTYNGTMTLHVGGETVELIHAPRAHTDNDSLVFFHRANVIHTSGSPSSRWPGPPDFLLRGCVINSSWKLELHRRCTCAA